MTTIMQLDTSNSTKTKTVDAKDRMYNLKLQLLISLQFCNQDYTAHEVQSLHHSITQPLLQISLHSGHHSHLI